MRIAREGFEVATAAEDDARIKLRDWTLERRSDGSFQARLRAADFALDIVCTPTQPLLLQGAQGLSRKGPEAAQASYHSQLASSCREHGSSSAQKAIAVFHFFFADAGSK